MTHIPEWDDESRGRALRLTEWEDDLCKCGCGQPIGEAHDPEQPYLVDTYKCYAGRAIKQIERQKRDDAEKAKWADGWDDGLHYYARKPTEKELAKGPKPPPQRKKR